MTSSEYYTMVLTKGVDIITVSDAAAIQRAIENDERTIEISLDPFGGVDQQHWTTIVLAHVAILAETPRLEAKASQGPGDAGGGQSERYFDAKPQDGQGAAMIVEVSFDGGCVSNPNGQASSAAIVRDQDGRTLRHVGLAIGIASNNVAEWRALQLGLETARGLGAAGVRAYGDSKLVVQQFSGAFAIREERLKMIALEVSRLAQGFREGVKVTWVPREANRAADASVRPSFKGATSPMRRWTRRRPSRPTSQFRSSAPSAWTR